WGASMTLLGTIQDERAAAPLARQLTNADANRRSSAETALGALGRTAGEKAVLEYLYDRNGDARAAANRLLVQQYRTPAGVIIDQAVKDIAGEPEVRRLVADDLSKRTRLADKQIAVAAALDELVKGKDLPLRQVA